MRRIKQNTRLTQTISLVLSTALSIIMGLFINLMLTRILGKEGYGNYSLFINILQLSQVIFNFGLFQSLCRLAAIEKEKFNTKSLYYVGLLIVFVIFILMATALVIYSQFNASIRNHLQGPMTIVIAFSWVYLITNLNEYYLQGTNQISLLSQNRILPKIFYSIVLACLINASIGLSYLLIIYFSTYILVYIFIFIQIKPGKPTFRIRSLLKEVLTANKEFGFNIYIGGLFATGSAYLSGLLISHYNVDNIQVGYFNLANQLCSPLSIFPNILATVFFKQFASEKKINNKLLLITFLLNALLLLLIVKFSSPLIILFFGKEYEPTSTLVNYLAFGYILYGFADFYNRFFLSKGLGRELRNASFIVGGTLLFSNLILVKYFDAVGASIARIISGGVYLFIIMVLYYNTVKRS